MLDTKKIRSGDRSLPISADARFKLAKVGNRMLTREPFYAALWLQMRPVLSWDLPTAWVTDRGIFVNPDMLEQMTLPECVFVSFHEILHHVFFHISRARRMFGDKPTPAQMKLWNFAGDAIINDLLERKYKRSGTPAVEIAMPVGPDGRPVGVLLKEGFVDGKTIEQVYRELLQEIQDDPSGGTAQQFEDFEGDVFMESPAETGDGEQGEGSGSGDKPGNGQIPGSGKSPGSLSAQEAQLRATISAAVEAAKQRGSMPAGLEELVAQVMVTTKPYRELLRDAMVPLLAGNDDYSWRTPHRGYRQVGVYAPAIATKLGVRNVCFWIDTSGSQSKEEIDECIAEALSVCSEVGIEEAHMVYADCTIHRVDIVKIGETYTPTTAPGRGGTDVREVFEYAEKHGAEMFVGLTDGYVEFVDPPEGMPVAWVMTTSVVAPYGTTIPLRG